MGLQVNEEVPQSELGKIQPLAAGAEVPMADWGKVQTEGGDVPAELLGAIVPTPDYSLKDYASKMWQSAKAAPEGIQESLHGLNLMASDLTAKTFPQVNATSQIDLATPRAESEAETLLRQEEWVKAQEAQDVAAKARPDTTGMGPFMREFVNAPEQVSTSVAALSLAPLVESALPMAAGFGLQQAGRSYLDALNEGKAGLPAAGYAVTQGAIEGGFEMIPGSMLLKDLGAHAGLMQTLKHYLVREYGSEIATTLAQNLDTWIQLHPEKSVGDFLKEQPEAIIGTIGGVTGQAGMQSGAIAGVRKGLSFAARQAEKAAELERIRGGIMPDNGAGLPDLTAPNTAPDTITPPENLNATTAPATPLPGIFNDTITAHPEIPETPLTSAEEIIAADQEQKLKTGVSYLPENPEGAADTVDLDEALKGLDTDANLGRTVEERRLIEAATAEVAPSQREIAWSSLAEEQGLTPRQLPPQMPGTVRILSGGENQLSEALIPKLGQSVEIWAKKYLSPEARVLVNLGGLDSSKVGAYTQLRSGIHVITPRELVRTARAEDSEGLNQYNQFTQSQFLFGLHHEFGHAIFEDQFTRGLAPAQARQISSLNTGRMLTEVQLQKLPELQQQVVREFQALKESVLAGQLSAKQLVDQWLGVWKIGRDLMKTSKETKSLYTYARKMLAGTDNEGRKRISQYADGKVYIPKTLETATALDLIHAMGRNTQLTEAESNAKAQAYYLSFEEFMAEQFTRHAYQKKITQTTPLGQYFARVLATLQNFFKELKKERVVKAGTAFNAWLDEVVKARALVEAEKPAKTPKPAKVRKPRTVQETIKEAVKENPKAPTALQDLASDKEWQAEMRKRVTDVFPPMPARTAREKALAKAILEEIGRGNDLEVEEMLADYQRGKPKFDVKGKGGAWQDSAEMELGRALYTWLQKELPYEMTDAEEDAYVQDTRALYHWVSNITRTYINKYAGTKQDPLKDVLVPSGAGFQTWESLMDSAIQVRERKDLGTMTSYREMQKGLSPTEPIWSFSTNSALLLLRDYLKHVTDYVKGKEIPREKLLQYGFTKLILEVAADDARVRAAAEKAMAAKMDKVPVVAEYADGGKMYQFPDVTSSREVMDTVVTVSEAGGWCTQKEASAVEYGSKENSLYMLMDAAGKPRAQIQIQTAEDGTQSIEQLKGRFNKEVEAEGLADVQEFVRAGNWVSARDLEYAKMVDLQDTMVVPEVYYNQLEEQFGTRYVRKEDLFPILDPLLQQAIPDLQVRLPAGTPITVRIAELSEEQKRAYLAQLIGLTQTDAQNLRYDEDSEAAQNAISNSNAASAALKRIRYPDSLWAAKAINFAANLKYNVLQLQQVAFVETDRGVKEFVHYMNKLLALKNNLMAQATSVAERVEKLSQPQFDTLSKMLKVEDDSGVHVTELTKVDNRWVHKATPQMAEWMKELGIDPTLAENQHLAQIMVDFKNSILEHIDTIEAAAVEQLIQRFHNAPLVLRKRVNEIREVARKWREAPYLPKGHFGNFFVKVFAQTDKGKEMVYLQHFASEAEQDVTVKKLLARYPKDKVVWGKWEDKTNIALVLPREFLSTLADTGEFSDEQLQLIGETMLPVRADKSFKTFARDAERTAGHEPDILRNYAHWIEDSANATAKFMYGIKLLQSIALTRAEVKDAVARKDIRMARKFQRLADKMSRTRGYLMHPADEYHKIRNTIALIYLVWAPRTVLMNLTGLIPAWVGLTSEFGDLKGNAEFARTMKDLTTGRLSEMDHWVLGKAESDGLVNQGFGYFMAGLANAGNLARRIRASGFGKLQRLIVEGGMKPFTAVEMVNRKVTLLSFFRLEFERNLKGGRILPEYEGGRPMTREEAAKAAYEAATTKTRLLQNDYSAANRPDILQGKKSVMMIFLSYPQYMLRLMTGGYEGGVRKEAKLRGDTPRSRFGGFTMRMWLIFALLAGYQGVPFGEFLEKLVQWLWRKFGKGDNATLEAHKFMHDTLGIESLYWRRVIQSGFLHNVGGVDLSKSYGMGYPLPGLNLIEANPKTGNEALGAAVKSLGGPAGGVAADIAGLSTAKEIGLKELARNLPGEAGNLARAVQAATTGLVNEKGARILKDERGRPRDATPAEIALIAMGFPLTEVTEYNHIRTVERDIADYWIERRQGLLKDYTEAVKGKDRKEVDDVRQALMEYNREAPPSLRILGKDVTGHVRENLRSVQKQEAGVVPKGQQSVHREVQSLLANP